MPTNGLLAGMTRASSGRLAPTGHPVRRSSALTYPGDVSLPTEIFTDPLDQEAVRAVHAAGQFPAPPAGVLDPDGRLRFQFGFVVTTHGGRPKSYGP